MRRQQLVRVTAALAALGAAVGVVGCSGDDCKVDADCLGDLICSAGECVTGEGAGGSGTGGAGGAGGAPLGDRGDDCEGNADCESGFCVENVCCDSACGGTCVACTQSKTGAADGSCVVVTAGTDPEGECNHQPPDTCGANGTGCNGDAAAPGCNLHGSASACGPMSCSGGILSQPDVCDGNGSCVEGSTEMCVPYACNGTFDGCLQMCSVDNQCDANGYCTQFGQCVGKKPDGILCGGQNECESGNCIEGVCCDTACDLGCDVCSVALGATTNGVCEVTCASTELCEDGACCEDCGGNGCCQGGQICSADQCITPLLNGSFETGDFTGWEAQDMASPYSALTVAGNGTQDPLNGQPVSATDGIFFVLNGFDGCGPDEILVGQDITVPASATLTFDYRGGWSIFGMFPRVFELRIEPAGGGMPLEVVNVVTAMPGDGNTGPQTGTVDLSAYAGQDVFLRFAWVVPECFSGPASFMLDNVQIN